MSKISDKPVEVAMSAVAILVGLSMAGFIDNAVWQTVGSVLASLGGALLAWTVSTIPPEDFIERARVSLRPELQAASRHLADISGKISRIVVLATRDQAISSDIAIDRIAQLTSLMYGIINDLDAIAGEKSSFVDVVETVSACEDLALQLERLTASAPHEADDPQLVHLRSQIESLRLQFASVRRTAIDPTSPPEDVVVSCPYCDSPGEVALGRFVGDSAMNTCEQCQRRYHVHRSKDGVFTREWGGSPTKRVESKCPECGSRVPVNFKEGADREERICLSCGALLQIDLSGNVSVTGSAQTKDAAELTFQYGRAYFQCPGCSAKYPALIWDEEFYKGVCNRCGLLLRAPRGQVGPSN